MSREKLNSLDLPMITALHKAALDIEASRETRVAILSGEGKAFCAGGDIAAWGGLPALDMWRDWTRAGHRAFEALARLRVPLIAALTGHAFGGGLELAAVADIRIAESGIKLGLPESGLGMAPGWSGTQRLVRRFGSSVVRRMALTGAMFTAEDGLALGLVEEVVPAGQGLARAAELAAAIAKRGPVAVQIVKAMINAAEGEDSDVAIEGLAGALTAKLAALPRASRPSKASAPRISSGAEELADEPLPSRSVNNAEGRAGAFPRERSMWIGGKPVDGSGARIERQSPAHGVLVTSVPRGAADRAPRSPPHGMRSTRALGRTRPRRRVRAFCSRPRSD